jgi:hypothetical protein
MIAFMLLKISDRIMDEDVDVGQDTQVGQFSCQLLFKTLAKLLKNN